MLNRCKRGSSHYVVIFFLIYAIPIVSAILCYECESTFPGNNICLPACAQVEQENSTCILIRDIPLATSGSGSVRASHIFNQSVLLNAKEKHFLFGEEAVFQNTTETTGWDWQYGQITYGCDTSGCNNPQIVNRLPKALNVHISNEALNQSLLGEQINTCYQCDICVDANNPSVNMSACSTTPCSSYSCNFVATRHSPRSIEQCGNDWRFTSGCILSQEPAQVDMILMYYIDSNTVDLYEMQAICRSDNCNNVNTFVQLKNNITIDPDFSCLFPTTTTTSTSTTSNPTTATTSTNFADRIQMNGTLLILMIFLFIYQTIKH